MQASSVLMSAKQLIVYWHAPFTDCNKTHFRCKFWLHSLDMKPFDWSEWYMWPKMAFKMSQEFPTASLDIKIFIFYWHRAYICYSILKTKTYNWLPNTHTHTHTSNSNYKQKATGHVISLANGHFTCAKFRPLRVTETEIILLTASGDARRLWSNEGTFQAFALVWQTAQNGRLHKTGGTYYQSCMYPTNSAWPAFVMPFLLLLPVSAHLPRGFTAPPPACLLCATPAGTYWVQSPGFPKILSG